MGGITYRSSNNNIASVDNTGKVTAKQRGIVTIIAEDPANGYVAESIINVVSSGATAISNVVSGTTFTAMLKEDGTVWTSGATASGELGNGSNITISEPVQVKINASEYLTDIRKIEVGTQHVIALRKDGTVWAWGLNSSGQLGNGTTTLSRYAIQVKNESGDGFLENVVDISAGADFSAAVMENKTLYVWGNASNNALGLNSTANQTLPAKVHDSYNVIQAQCGSDTIMLLKGDGTVWGAGYNNVGQIGDNTTTTRPEIVPTLSSDTTGILNGVMRITSALHTTVGIKEDKTAWIWGYNNNGQLGINSTTASLHPIQMTGLGNTGVMENIVNVGAGPTSIFVEDESGNVYASGLNTNGELSLNTKTTVKVFTIVKNETGTESLMNVANLGRSMGTTYGFVMDDGSVGITGLGTSGQHANGTLTTTSVITKIEDAKISCDKMYQIIVNGTEKIEVNLKQNFNLNIVNTNKIKLENISYTSLNDEIATVDSDGTIKGIKEGTTGIKVVDTETGLECVAYVVVGNRDFSDITKIVSADTFTVLLKNDGTVWTWGNNTYGQLGNGKVENENTIELQQVLGINGEGYLNDIIDISAGQYFVTAVRKNGEVVSWGRNNVGQLGTTADTAEYPVKVIEKGGNVLTGAIQVSTTATSVAVVKADGTVWTWGENTYGQLGQNDAVSSTFAVQVKDSAGTGYLNNIKQVAGGGVGFFSALTNEGTVYSWGYGVHGALGNSAKTTKYLPVEATNVTDVKKIVAGYYHVVALKNDGTVWSWGLNRYGQLGIGVASTSTSNANYYKSVAQQVKLDASTFLTGVKDIGANFESSYAITEDGIVYNWGLNGSGQLADNTTTNKSYPVVAVRRYNDSLENNLKKVQSNSSCSYTNYIIKDDGSLLGYGKTTQGQILDVMPTQYTYRGYVDDMQCSYLEITDKNSYIKKGESKKLTARIEENLNVYAKSPDMGSLTWESTNTDVATVDENGTVTTKNTGVTTIIVTESNWGYTAQSKVYVTSNESTSIAAPMIVQGTSFTALLKADGTVWTSGLNTSGQLGTGDTTYRGDFTKVKIDDETYLSNVIKIAAGTSHMLALTKDGEVYSWGLGTSGQLGQDSTTNYSYAVKVKDESGEGYLSGIIDISAGSAHSVAITNDGKAYAWGLNSSYQLGDCTTTLRKLPVRITDIYNVVGVSAGGTHTIFLRGDGVVATTGNSANGQTAINNTTNAMTPLETKNGVELNIMKNAIDVKGGANHSVVLTKDGKVYVSGLNTSSQLSQNNTTQSLVFISAKIMDESDTIVEVDNIASISAGSTATYAVTKSGEVLVAGLNTAGQLGLGDTTSPVSLFEKVKNTDGSDTLQNIDYAVNGQGNTINSAFIAKDGLVYTCGTATNGQLANGEYINSYLPVIAGNNKLSINNIYVNLKVNDTYAIETSLVQGVNAYNTNKEIKNLAYESNNTSVASVDTNGQVTAKSAGYAIIKITDLDNEIEEYVKINVYEYKGTVVPDVQSGLNFSIALKADGTVWSWGVGTSGRLGTGNTNNQTEPVQVLAPDGKNKLTNSSRI